MAFKSASELNVPIVINQWEGMMSLFDSVIIPDFYLANSVNCSCQGLGSIGPFQQFSPFASIAGSGSIISSQTVYKADAGLNQSQIPIIDVDNGSYVVKYWYNAANNSLEYLTALAKHYATGVAFVTADFNTATADGCFFCNGVDEYTAWNKAIGTVASNDATSITLNEADAAQQGFEASGTVLVSGVEYAYTSISGNQLLGLTALPTFAVDAGVSQKVDISADATDRRFNIMWVNDGRIWGSKYSSIRILYSKVGDGTDWTPGTDPADPGFKDFIEGSGGMRAIASIDQWEILFKDDIVIAYTLQYPTSTTRTELVKEIKRGKGVGAVCQQSTIKIGQELYYASSLGGIKMITSSETVTDGFDFNDLTEDVRPTLTNGVFDLSARAMWNEKDRTYSCAYKKNNQSTANDMAVVIEVTKGTDGTQRMPIGFVDWNVGSWFDYLGEVYFGSSLAQKCYKAFDGYQRGEADTAYQALFTLKRYRFSTNPLKQKQIRYLCVIGAMSDGGIMNFQLDLNYLGSLAHLEASLSAEETQYFVEPQFNTIGSFANGTEPIGGTLQDIQDLKYFNVYFTIPPEFKPFDMQLTAYTAQAGIRWKIESIVFDVFDAERDVDSNLKKAFIKN